MQTKSGKMRSLSLVGMKAHSEPAVYVNKTRGSFRSCLKLRSLLSPIPSLSRSSPHSAAQCDLFEVLAEPSKHLLGSSSKKPGVNADLLRSAEILRISAGQWLHDMSESFFSQLAAAEGVRTLLFSVSGLFIISYL